MLAIRPPLTTPHTRLDPFEGVLARDQNGELYLGLGMVGVAASNAFNPACKNLDDVSKSISISILSLVSVSKVNWIRGNIPAGD